MTSPERAGEPAGEDAARLDRRFRPCPQHTGRPVAESEKPRAEDVAQALKRWGDKNVNSD